MMSLDNRLQKWENPNQQASEPKNELSDERIKEAEENLRAVNRAVEETKRIGLQIEELRGGARHYQQDQPNGFIQLGETQQGEAGLMQAGYSAGAPHPGFA